jgi:hypothetical protein
VAGTALTVEVTAHRRRVAGALVMAGIVLGAVMLAVVSRRGQDVIGDTAADRHTGNLAGLPVEIVPTGHGTYAVTLVGDQAIFKTHKGLASYVSANRAVINEMAQVTPARLVRVVVTFPRHMRFEEIDDLALALGLDYISIQAQGMAAGGEHFTLGGGGRPPHNPEEWQVPDGEVLGVVSLRAKLPVGGPAMTYLLRHPDVHCVDVMSTALEDWAASRLHGVPRQDIYAIPGRAALWGYVQAALYGTATPRPKVAH